LQLHRQFDSSAARYRLFGLAQATFLVLAPAAAGARVVAPGRGPDLSVAPTHKLHHKGGRLAPPPERDHFLHIRVDMIKEVPVPLAEVVETRLAVRRLDEPVFRTAAVAHEADLALEAVPGKRLLLTGAK